MSRLRRIMLCSAVMLVVLGFGPGRDSSALAGEPKHLTPAQLRILALPGVEAPPAKFSFDRPPGPQFTEAEQATQREAAQRIIPMVLEAFRAGSNSVTIPAGDYRFGKERWDREGVVYPLEFSGLKRNPEQTFLIDASGATFWFDLPDDQAPTAHFSVGFRECDNIVFRGATLDRGTRGHVEGRITGFDFARNRIELQLSPGLTVPSKFSDGLEQRVVPFKADGTFVAPLYDLQKGGTRLKYRTITPGTLPGRYWITMREPALLDTIRNPDWQRAYGEQGVLRVGDGLSCVYAVSCAIELVRCRNVTLENLRVFMPKGWGAEWGGAGGHLWKNCYFGPRPGTCQWQGGEGFMFCATRGGTTLDHVTIRHTTDDTANFHGYWGNIKSVDGNRVTFELNHEFRRTVLRDAAIGDQLVFHDKMTGQTLGSRTLAAVEGATVTLDETAERFTNAIVEWPEHACADWTIQNCHWEDNYQRLLIQSGPGTVRNCTFTRLGSALELNSVMPYVEGGVPRDITITGNVFSDVNPVPHGAAITVYAHTFGRGAPILSNLVVTGNTFVHPGEAAISLRQVSGGVLASNRFEQPIEYTALARPQEPRRQQAVWLSRCTNFVVSHNILIDPGNRTAPDPLTGSAVLGCDNQCQDITLDGKPVARSELRVIAGWTIHIRRELLAQESRQTERVLELLQKQLEEIARVVPAPALARLRKVPLYVSPEYPGVKPRAEFHPGAGWLRDNGRDPTMAKGVEFTNVRIFEQEMNRMPNFALHELAHAYHDRFLPQGFANPEVKAAYEKARAGGKYDRVERWHGNGKPNTFERAYAMTNPQEFFAENTEAFFSRNDYFPFTREELKRHDPDAFKLLEKLWNLRPEEQGNKP